MSKPAIWYFEQPGGTWVARCYDFPNWKLVAATLTQAREQSEDSLRDHIAKHAEFFHFEPRRLREAAA